MDKHYEDLLDELFQWTLREELYGLTDKEKERYVEIVDILHNNNINIPFGIKI